MCVRDAGSSLGSRTVERGSRQGQKWSHFGLQRPRTSLDGLMWRAPGRRDTRPEALAAQGRLSARTRSRQCIAVGDGMGASLRFSGGDHAIRVPCDSLSGTPARECPATVRATGLDNVATGRDTGLISRVQKNQRLERLALAERLLRMAEERIPGHHGPAGRKPVPQMPGTRSEIQLRKERPDRVTSRHRRRWPVCSRDERSCAVDEARARKARGSGPATGPDASIWPDSRGIGLDHTILLQ